MQRHGLIGLKRFSMPLLVSCTTYICVICESTMWVQRMQKVIFSLFLNAAMTFGSTLLAWVLFMPSIISQSYFSPRIIFILNFNNKKLSSFKLSTTCIASLSIKAIYIEWGPNGLQILKFKVVWKISQIYLCQTTLVFSNAKNYQNIWKTTQIKDLLEVNISEFNTNT
jgi:hypothetical protein